MRPCRNHLFSVRDICEFQTSLKYLNRHRGPPSRAQICVNVVCGLVTLINDFILQIIASRAIAAIGVAGKQVLHASVPLALRVYERRCH